MRRRVRSMNYNHALCVWRPAALARMYALAVEHLVQTRHYPEAVRNLKCAVHIGPVCCVEPVASHARAVGAGMSRIF
jgi:hypothetical protein